MIKLSKKSLEQAEVLGRRLARSEMKKEGSLADAILGAPLGAVAARIAAPEESKKKATIHGLLLGALMGFAAGQRSLAKEMDKAKGKKPKESKLDIHPLVASLLAGTAVGAGHSVSKALPEIGKLLPNTKK